MEVSGPLAMRLMIRVNDSQRPTFNHFVLHVPFAALPSSWRNALRLAYPHYGPVKRIPASTGKIAAVTNDASSDAR